MWIDGFIDWRLNVLQAFWPLTARQASKQGFETRFGSASTGMLTPKRLPEEGAVSAGRRRYSLMDAAVTAWTSSAEWAISTLRGFASSATGIVRVRTPLS